MKINFKIQSLSNSRASINNLKLVGPTCKQGVRVYRSCGGIFACFGKAVKIEDAAGKIWYVNKNSLQNWMNHIVPSKSFKINDLNRFIEKVTKASKEESKPLRKIPKVEVTEKKPTQPEVNIPIPTQPKQEPESLDLTVAKPAKMQQPPAPPQLVKAPLPTLLNFVPAERSALLAPLPALAFLSSTLVQFMNSGLDLDHFLKLKKLDIFQVTLEQLVSVGYADTTLLDLAVRECFKNHLSLLTQGIFEEPQRANSLKHIKERLEDLEGSLQLSERLQRLQFPLHIQMKDLVAAWPVSPLKFVLMMDDEVKALKLGDVANLSHEQIERGLLPRLKDFNTHFQSHFNASGVTPENVSELRLVDLEKLKASKITELAEHLPPFVFRCIPVTEIPALDVSKLSKEQLNVLWRSKEYVQALKVSQVNACFAKIDSKFLGHILFVAESENLKLQQAG